MTLLSYYSIMKTITNALAAIVIGSLAFVPSAQSKEVCTTHQGIDLCADTGRGYDEVTLAGPINGEYYRESFKIQCHESKGWSFESKGNLTDDMAKNFVKGYCEGRGYIHRGPQL